MSLLLTARPRASADTYLMARQHILWPAFATASSGGVRSGSAASMWGGYYDSPNGTVGHYYEWADRVLQPGTYKISILGWKDNYCGTYHVIHDGDDTGARLDMYRPSNAWNQVVSDTFTIATKARGAIRLSMDSKNASSSQHYANVQQVAIEKISSDSDEGESVDDLPWAVDVPLMAYSSTSGGWARDNNTAYVGGGTTLYSDNADGRWIDYKVWLPAGTWSFSVIHYRGTGQGILEVLLDSSAVGTIDFYGSAATVAGTVSSITVPETKIYTVRLATNGKNASASSYGMQFNAMQFRRTA